MKDCQNRFLSDRRNSLIATLMGFDELRLQPPIPEKRRGLSESYVRNAASIGVRRGSLVSVGRSCSTNNELVSGVQVSKSKNDSWDMFVSSRTSSVRKGLRNSVSLFGDSYENRKSIGKNHEHCAKHALRRQQKHEHDSLHLGELCIDSMRKSLDSPLDMIDNTRCFSTSMKGVYDVKNAVSSTASPRHSCIACSRNMNRIPQQERCRSKFEAVLEPGYRSYSNHPHSVLGRSSLGNGSKKRNLRRWKMAKKVQEFGASGRNQNLNQLLALADQISKQRNLDVKSGKTSLCPPTSLLSRSSDSRSSSVLSSLDGGDDKGQKSQPVSEFEAVKDILSTGWISMQYDPIAMENKSEEQTTSQKKVLESKSGKGNEQFQASLGVDEIMSPDSKVSEFSSCSFSCFGSTFNDPEAYILGIRDEMDNSFENDIGTDNEPSATVGDSSRTFGDPESELNPCTILEEGGQSSAIEEIFSREASLNEYFEEESLYSNFSPVGAPKSLENLEETSQHSPDSVLEPYDRKKSSSFECFDNTGLQLQLESLNFESGDPYSEGSVMVISGDEDAEEQFGDLSHDIREVKRWLGNGESRNFSYMVDVLDEAGFCGMNSYMDFKMWHSLECPISPLVFEALEKRYGKQKSWQNSERQLVFDRINSGLVEIFNPIVNFHAVTTSVRRRFCASFRLDEVVDELWMKLVIQEKEKSKELSEKALEKWLELEEGIDIICRELEASLFDELAMEFW